MKKTKTKKAGKKKNPPKNRKKNQTHTDTPDNKLECIINLNLSYPLLQKALHFDTQFSILTPNLSGWPSLKNPRKILLKLHLHSK